MADLISIYEEEVCHKVDVGAIAFDMVKKRLCIVHGPIELWPNSVYVNYFPGIWADYEIAVKNDLIRVDMKIWFPKIDSCPCDPVCDFCIDLAIDYDLGGMHTTGWCKTHGQDKDLSDSCSAFKCKKCEKTY